MLAVLRKHPRFRRLWAAQLVSNAGDWFNRIALLTLIGRLGGADVATSLGLWIGLEFALRTTPHAMFSPLAGPFADRLSRRTILVVTDVARAAVVLCFVFVQDPSLLWLLYGLLALQMALSVFFESAWAAALPGTVDSEDLHDAYALSAVSWSAMLAFGAAAGGLAVELLGTTGVFVVDAASYLVSAGLLLRLSLSAVPEHPEPFRWRDILLAVDLRRGLAHATGRRVRPALLVKTFWWPCGGFIVLLSLAGQTRFAGQQLFTGQGQGAGAWLSGLAVGPGLATGLLFAARGFGTGIGPILGRRLVGKTDIALRRQITAGFLLAAAGYAVFAQTDTLLAACAAVLFAHVGGSMLWVASTTLWQKHIDDAFRGRVFACEFLCWTMVFAAAGMGAGWFHDQSSLTLTVMIGAAATLVSGLAWTWYALRTERSTSHDDGPAPARPTQRD